MQATRLDYGAREISIIFIDEKNIELTPPFWENSTIHRKNYFVAVYFFIHFLERKGFK